MPITQIMVVTPGDSGLCGDSADFVVAISESGDVRRERFSEGESLGTMSPPKRTIGKEWEKV